MAETRSTCCPNPEEESSPKNRPSNLPTWGFLLLLALVVAVSVADVIIWVMIFPEPFHMKVEVEDMTAPKYHITNNSLDAKFNFTIGFNNTNRMVSIYYRGLNVTIERDNQTLASKDYSNPFNEAQSPSNMTFLLHGTTKSSRDNGNPLNDTTLGDLKQISSEDISIVDVRIMARIELWTRYWGSSKGHVIGILCSNVSVHPPNNPSTSTPCNVDLDFN